MAGPTDYRTVGIENQAESQLPLQNIGQFEPWASELVDSGSPYQIFKRPLFVED